MVVTMLININFVTTLRLNIVFRPIQSVLSRKDINLTIIAIAQTESVIIKQLA